MLINLTEGLRGILLLAEVDYKNVYKSWLQGPSKGNNKHLSAVLKSCASMH